MRGILEACGLAFSMYSRIPVPYQRYREESAQYTFCFFPLIGIVLGILELAAYQILIYVKAGSVFRGAVLAAVPLLLTGGIHMDGFLDTVDARSSFADRERKLQILKDPHIGSFAMIYGGLYLLMDAAAWSEGTWRSVVCMGLFFAAERAASAFIAVSSQQAGAGSSLNMFRKDTAAKTVRVVQILWLVISFAAMILIWPAGAVATILALGLMIFRYIHVAKKDFGGIRGDLAGWFLQSSELAALLILLLLEKISVFL